MCDYSYSNIRRVQYEGGQTFIPVCPKCGRFVKADASILGDIDGRPSKDPNATCKKDGRINMPFVGFE